MKALLSSTYFGPIQWYQKLNRYDECLIERHESFIKQTYRNRMIIPTTNGPLSLTIPTNHDISLSMKDIRISDHANWRHVHWNALLSAYGESPFFEYYQDDIRPFYEKKYEFLFDFNMETTQKMIELLDIRPKISVTAEYFPKSEGSNHACSADCKSAETPTETELGGRRESQFNGLANHKVQSSKFQVQSNEVQSSKFQVQSNEVQSSKFQVQSKELPAFLANGDRAKVLRVRRRIDLYGFRFATLLLQFPDYDNYELEATVLLDTLTSEAPALTHEQQEQLFRQIEEDYQDIPLKADRMKAIRQDQFFNALQVKFAYAVTCHKAQGGQWAHVYVDQGYMTDDMLTPDYIHWLYTAFTRATEKLYLVNWPETQTVTS